MQNKSMVTPVAPMSVMPKPAQKSTAPITAPTTTKTATPPPAPRPTAPPPPRPITQAGAVDATAITTTTTQMPAPTAQKAAEVKQAGIQQQVDSARTSLETKLAKERDRALQAQEQLNRQLQDMQKESDPTKRATYAQEQEILRNQLDAAETASRTLEQDFEKRRATVDELDRLLTEGNNLIAMSQGAPISLQALNKKTNRTIQDVQARAGVLEAVIAGVDGNIAQAQSLIQSAQGTVQTYWQDQVAYNNAYMSLVESGELAKNKIESDYASSQIALAESKLVQLEETSNYIQSLMIDPQSAQFIADAGITLNDSVDEVNAKMAEQNRKMEIQDTINELKMEGYQYVPFAGNRNDVVSLEVGGQTLSFVPPMEAVSGGGGGGGGGKSFVRSSQIGNIQIPAFEDFLSQKFPNQTPTPQSIAEARMEYEELKQQVVLGSMSELAQAVAQDPSQYHTLTASGKEDIFPELTAAGIKIPTKLGQEQLNAQNLAQSGLQALQEMEFLITQDDGTFNVGFMQANNPFGQFNLQKSGVIDAITRMRTGAAMTPSEETFYSNLIPNSFNDDATIRKKQEQLAVFFSGIAGNTIVLESPDGQLYSFDNLMDPRQRKDTRDALTNGYKLVDY